MKESPTIAVEDQEVIPARRLLRTREAYTYLGMSARTLWTLSSVGEIPTVRFGSRSVRYDIDDLNAWISARKGGR